MPSLKGILTTPLPRLHATEPKSLPFAPSLHMRAFVLEREHGNLLVYAAPSVGAAAPAIDALGGVTQQYLNHWHEAGFGGDGAGAPVVINAMDRAAAEDSLQIADSFSDRALLDDDFELIPTPGHTPGATAYLWHNGEQRVLFTGDSVYLRDGEWVAAVLEGSSDRAAYIESLELLRGLEFDALVPWAAKGEPYYSLTDSADARNRIDVILNACGVARTTERRSATPTALPRGGRTVRPAGPGSLPPAAGARRPHRSRPARAIRG